MLILQRHIGQRIRIECPDGNVVWITLVDVQARKVRIGIDAPLAFICMREELLPPDQDTAAEPGQDG